MEASILERQDDIEINALRQSAVLLQALGESVAETAVIAVAVEPTQAELDGAAFNSSNSNQCQQSNQSQQSYSCFSSQNSTRCSHGCHGPR